MARYVSIALCLLIFWNPEAVSAEQFSEEQVIVQGVENQANEALEFSRKGSRSEHWYNKDVWG